MSNIQEATAELHRCFKLFNDHLFDGALPEPAITIQTAGKRQAYGWCSTVEYWQAKDGSVKKYEINLSAEYINRDVTDVMRTLLHEMVHLYNATNGIQDCSRGGQYHNKRFKEACEARGFYFDEQADKRIGWSRAKLKPETIELISTFNIDANAFQIARTMPTGTKGKGNTIKLECPNCGITLRATKRGIAVLCKQCEVELVEY